MTRKHYIVIAGAIRKYRDSFGEKSKRICDPLIAHMVQALKEDNPRFDTQHFVEVVTGQRELTSHPSRKLVTF